MAKLGSLQDLSSVFGGKAEEKNVKRGYDGQPQVLSMKAEQRRGKTVTVIRGFQSNPQELDEIVNSLKKACGAGGQVLDNCVELQGDHQVRARKFLTERGYSWGKK